MPALRAALALADGDTDAARQALERPGLDRTHRRRVDEHLLAVSGSPDGLVRNQVTGAGLRDLDDDFLAQLRENHIHDSFVREFSLHAPYLPSEPIAGYLEWARLVSMYDRLLSASGDITFLVDLARLHERIGQTKRAAELRRAAEALHETWSPDAELLRVVLHAFA